MSSFPCFKFQLITRKRGGLNQHGKKRACQFFGAAKVNVSVSSYSECPPTTPFPLCVCLAGMSLKKLAEHKDGYENSCTSFAEFSDSRTDLSHATCWREALGELGGGMCTDGRKDQEAACVRVTVSVTVALVLPNPRKGLKQSQAIKTEARRVEPDLTNHSLSPPVTQRLIQCRLWLWPAEPCSARRAQRRAR